METKEKIKSLAKGPIKFPGDFSILGHSALKCVRGGDVNTTTASFCRCGKTTTYPVCSGAHDTDPPV